MAPRLSRSLGSARNGASIERSSDAETSREATRRPDVVPTSPADASAPKTTPSSRAASATHRRAATAVWRSVRRVDASANRRASASLGCAAAPCPEPEPASASPSSSAASRNAKSARAKVRAAPSARFERRGRGLAPVEKAAARNASSSSPRNASSIAGVNTSATRSTKSNAHGFPFPSARSRRAATGPEAATARATARAVRPSAKHSNLENPHAEPNCASVAARTPTPAGAGASPPSSSVPSSYEGHSGFSRSSLPSAGGVGARLRRAVAAAESAGNTNAPALSGTNGAGKRAATKRLDRVSFASFASFESFESFESAFAFVSGNGASDVSSVAKASAASSPDPQSPHSAAANASSPRGADADPSFAARGADADPSSAARIASTPIRSARACFASASAATALAAAGDAPAARAAALLSAACASAAAAVATSTLEASGLCRTSARTSGATVSVNLCVKTTSGASAGRGAPATSTSEARWARFDASHEATLASFVPSSSARLFAVVAALATGSANTFLAPSPSRKLTPQA